MWNLWNFRDESDLTSILSRAKVGFNPSASIVPFPNNLLPRVGRLSTTVNIPAGATSHPRKLLESILNTLDGFGVYQYPIQFTFGAVDATVAENVTLIDLESRHQQSFQQWYLVGTRSFPDVRYGNASNTLIRKSHYLQAPITWFSSRVTQAASGERFRR